MIRPAGDTPVLSKWGGFSLLFRARNYSKLSIFATDRTKQYPHNQADYIIKLIMRIVFSRGRRVIAERIPSGAGLGMRCLLRVSRYFWWRNVAVIDRSRQTHANPPMISWCYPISLMLWAVFFLPVKVSKTDAAICICGCIKQRIGKMEPPHESKRRNDDTVFLSRYARYYTIHYICVFP